MMKIYLVILFILSISGFAHGVEEFTLGVGIDFECTLHKGVVKCDGSLKNKYHPTQVPPLQNPRQLSVGRNFACVLEDRGLVCWGSEMNVPSLVKPVLLATSSSRICVIDQQQVKCWGAGGNVNIAPTLKNPRALWVGELHTVALDDDGFHCWGTTSQFHQCDFPKFKNLRQISVGSLHTCALDDDGVKCWGNNNHTGALEIPPLKNPRQISSGAMYSCALDDEGVKCWGDKEFTRLEPQFSRTHVPPLDHPTKIVAGWGSVCAVHARGLSCWGIILDK